MDHVDGTTYSYVNKNVGLARRSFRRVNSLVPASSFCCFPRRLSIKYQSFVLLSFLICLVLLFAELSNFRISHHLVGVTLEQDYHSTETFKGCVWPVLDPFDETLLPFISHPRTLRCRQVQPDLVSVDSNGYAYVHARGTWQERFGQLRCFYRSMAGTLEPRKTEITYGLWALIRTPQFIPYDQFEVRCYERRRNKQGQYVIEDRLSTTDDPVDGENDIAPGSVQIYRNAFMQIGPREKQFTESSQALPSIDLFVLESISWNQFRRVFPMSWKFMEETMGFIFFEKHGKADENTLINLIPLLTGKRMRLFEMDRNFMGQDYTQKRPLDALSDFPWLWRNYSSKNCVTFLNDDPCHPDRGFMFYHAVNGSLTGFRAPPTDYYFRAAHLYHRSQQLYRERIAASQTRHCRGNDPYHKGILYLSLQFMEKYADTCRFSVSSSLHELMHDSVVDPELVDQDLRDFLARLHVGKSLQNSFFIMMGDHGHRLSNIKFTYLGQIEERTSALAIRVPDWFKQKHPRLFGNLKLNSQRLTNHFDVYQSMSDVFAGRLDQLDRQGDRDVHRLHGRSLFLPVPPNRDCKDADIPVHFCVCLEHVRDLDLKDESLRSAIEAAVRLKLRKDGMDLPETKKIGVVLLQGSVYTTNQYVQHMVRHFFEVTVKQLKRKTEGAIEYYEIKAMLLPSKRKFTTQIQRTKAVQGKRKETLKVIAPLSFL